LFVLWNSACKKLLILNPPVWMMILGVFLNTSSPINKKRSGWFVSSYCTSTSQLYCIVRY
jgi:hypothetical protein